MLTVRVEFCTSLSKQSIAEALNTSSCHHIFLCLFFKCSFQNISLDKIIVQIPSELKKLFSGQKSNFGPVLVFKNKQTKMKSQM